MALSSRQPFAELGSPRLQALQSAKNRQNAIATDFASPFKQSFSDFSSPLKQMHSVSRKRRAPSVFEDEEAENMDPATVNSPTKKSRTADGIDKPSIFSIFTSSSVPVQSSMLDTPSLPSVRKPLSSPKPNTTNSTPIALSRGSPKHKRVGLLSKRRASSSPFRRVDPPSFSHSQITSGLPFSIDAALKGSIPDYAPAPKATVAKPPVVNDLEAGMPKSWFFDIHEDTPEQEAANLMEHSASILDISSDDDCETKRVNEEAERGKENVPPSDFVQTQGGRRSSPNAMMMEEHVHAEPVKRARLRKIAQDAMDEDRKPLGDLPPKDFYGEGCDAGSYVTVDAGCDKPSRLKKELEVEVDVEEECVEAVTKETSEKAENEPEPVAEKFPIQIFADPVQEPLGETTVSLQVAENKATVHVSPLEDVSCPEVS